MGITSFTLLGLSRRFAADRERPPLRPCVKPITDRRSASMPGRPSPTPTCRVARSATITPDARRIRRIACPARRPLLPATSRRPGPRLRLRCRDDQFLTGEQVVRIVDPVGALQCGLVDAVASGDGGQAVPLAHHVAQAGGWSWRSNHRRAGRRRDDDKHLGWCRGRGRRPAPAAAAGNEQCEHACERRGAGRHPLSARPAAPESAPTPRPARHSAPAADCSTTESAAGPDAAGSDRGWPTRPSRRRARWRARCPRDRR